MAKPGVTPIPWPPAGAEPAAVPPAAPVLANGAGRPGDDALIATFNHCRDELVSTLLYLLGALRLWRQHRRWSVLRTVSFVSGCAVLAAVTGLAVEDYGEALLSVFMFQQLTLMMAIPPLLVLGSPGALLLRATPHTPTTVSTMPISIPNTMSRPTDPGGPSFLTLPAVLRNNIYEALLQRKGAVLLHDAKNYRNETSISEKNPGSITGQDRQDGGLARFGKFVYLSVD